MKNNQLLIALRIQYHLVYREPVDRSPKPNRFTQYEIGLQLQVFDAVKFPIQVCTCSDSQKRTK